MRIFFAALFLLPSLAFADDITPDSFANRIKSDALRLTVSNVLVRSNTLYIQGVPQGDPIPENARVSFTVENNSGVPLGMAIRSSGVSVGPCGRVETASGLGLFDDALAIQLQRNQGFRDRTMRLVPDHGRVSGMIELDGSSCAPRDVKGMTSLPVTITVMVASDNNFLAVPLSAEGRLTVQGY